MDHVSLVKWLHIVSSTILFGTGLGTAFFLWTSHQTGDARTIARVATIVVRADWIFTAPSGVVQPVTGLMLIHGLGYSLLEPWLVASYGLYLLAFLCWAPVVWLQIRMRDLAIVADAKEQPLPREYFRYARAWFFLGWPAFAALLTIFGLMIVKPV